MSIEQLKSQIITKGFEEGFEETPLKEFWGTLTDWIPTLDTRFQSDRPTIRNKLQFGDIVVIQTNDTYPFPNAEITINFSRKKDSKWGIFCQSVEKILGEFDSMDMLVGKTLRMKLTPDHMLYAGKEKGTIPQNAWECMEIQGVTAPGNPPAGASTASVLNATQQAVALLIGKTAQEFNQQVFQDPIVRTDNTLLGKILSQSLIPEFEAAGFVVKGADGRYAVGPNKA
jgi:hypothetical protein